MRGKRVPNISRPTISTAGFKAALKDRGVNPDEVTLFVGESSFEFGFKGVHEHFEELREADGVFAHSDIIAFAYSRVKLPLIPVESCHLFRCKVATYSG